MATVHNIYSEARAFAQEMVNKAVNSGNFKRTTLLTLLTGKGGNTGTIGTGGGTGRPGAELFGGVEGRAPRGIAGGTGILCPFHTEDNTVSANVTSKGTSPSQGEDYQADTVKHANMPFTKRISTIKVPQAYFDAASGDAQLIDALGVSVDLAMQKHMQTIGVEMITGSQTWSASALLNDTLAGLDSAIATSNTYAGIDRSTDTAWAAKVVSDYGRIDLGIVNHANIDEGIANYGPGVDVFITNNTLYRSLKDQANARDRTIETLTDRPVHSKIGQLREGFYSDGTLFLFDPSVASGVAYGLTLEDWEYYIHSNHNFRVTNFVNPVEEGRHGVQDALSANIITQHALICSRPWNQIKYTSLTA